MKSILFQPDMADWMNQKVSEKIAPHLFLFCNYQPDKIKVFSCDARFYQGVLNLYKLFEDASIIGMIPKIARPYRIDYNKGEIDDYRKKISMLRTVLGHNNGTSVQQEQYDAWIKQVTGKTELQKEEDYEPAVEMLEQIGKGICRALNKFIDRAALSTKKEKVIVSWEEAIFAFYKRKSGHLIFLGQMQDAYRSRCLTGDINIRKDRLKGKVDNWFKQYYCQREEIQIENFHKILEVYGDRLDTKTCDDIRKKAEEESYKLEKKKNEIAAKCGVASADELRTYHYQEYYCMELDKKLRNIFKKRKGAAEASMLPETLMQELIEEEFADIHSEDF